MKGRIVSRSEGTWQLIYDLPRGKDGKRKQGYATIKGTKREAEKELRKRLADIDAGLVVTTAKGTMSDHFVKWLETIQGKVGAKTYEGLSIVVTAHLMPYWGNRKLDSVQPTDCRDFVLFLEKEGNRQKGRLGQPLAPVTVHRIGSVFKQIMEEAVDLGVLPRNPAKVKLPPPKAKKKRILSQEEITRVMQATAKRAYLHEMILLGLTTGARRGEILALRWSDVNLESGQVTIARSMVEVGGEVTAKDPKTDAGTRTVFLPQFAREALIHHKGIQSRRRLELGPAWQDHDLIVCGPDGRPIRPSTSSVLMKEAMDALGLEGVTLHGLRHGFASLCIANGADLKTLQTVMGHENIAITIGLYGHLFGGEQAALADGLNTMLKDVMGL